MSELKPCPFCGGNAALDVSPHDKTVAVQCRLCTCSIVHCSGQEAIDFWNRRASPWIRFEDRKPLKGDKVLVRYADGVFGAFNTWTGGVPWRDDITHWMPIPDID